MPHTHYSSLRTHYYSMAALILFLLLIVLLLLGFPVAFTLAGVSILFGYFLFDVEFFYLLPLRIYGTMNNFVLISVPLFVYMGVMLEKSGIAERLLNTMALLFGRMKGGMAVAVILVGAMLAASTGIVGATVVRWACSACPQCSTGGIAKPWLLARSRRRVRLGRSSRRAWCWCCWAA